MNGSNTKRTTNSKTVNKLREVRNNQDAYIVNKLNDLGLNINSVYDLVNSKKSYANAIPALVNFLNDPKITDSIVLQGVVRALATIDSKGIANDDLFALFEKTPVSEDSLKWAIGNSLGFLATSSDFEKIKDLVEDKMNGISRQGLVSGLAKINTKDCRNLLMRLVDDTDVAAHAIEALKKQKCKEAITIIQGLLDSESRLIRNEAASFLKSSTKWT